jgi:6-phosphogluconolactonase/glucosamine-6-phosphate isomerase/deaminase
MINKLGNLEIIKAESKTEAVKKLAFDLTYYLTKAREQKIKVLFLSSGGGALSVLNFIHKDVLGDYLTIGVLDERYDKTNENNNFTQLTHTEFYKNAKMEGCGFIDTTVKPEQTQDELENNFEVQLRQWKEGNPKGEIIATVGVGSDGHTSGVMPFPENPELFAELFESEKWVIAYDATGKNEFTKRVTTTLTFIKKIDRVFILMTGKGKVEIFSKIKEDAPVTQLPSQILKKLTGGLYLDEEVLKE